MQLSQFPNSASYLGFDGTEEFFKILSQTNILGFGRNGKMATNLISMKSFENIADGLYGPNGGN
jgi:hypothetical protein